MNFSSYMHPKIIYQSLLILKNFRILIISKNWIPLLSYQMISGMSTFFIVIALTAIFICSHGEDEAGTDPKMYSFDEFKKIFGKSYINDGEEVLRRKIYQENVKKIKSHNTLPGITYKKGINQFTDLTESEFAATYLTLQVPNLIQKIFYRFVIEKETVAGESNVAIDWEAEGKVTSVKNQGSCNSCYSFATVAAVESAILIAEGLELDLSEQQIVDCSQLYGNQGCISGNVPFAYEFIKDYGLLTEAQYPYQMKQGDDCLMEDDGKYKIKDYVVKNTCKQLEDALKLTPVTVLVDSHNWMPYHSGIFSDCGTSVDHAVLLVGATDQFWRIKNSYGMKWGEKGYIRLARGNTCGICLYPSYPIYK